MARDNTVAQKFLSLQPKIVGAMLDKHSNLFKRPLIDQQVETLASGELPFFVLIFDPLFSTSEQRVGFLFPEALSRSVDMSASSLGKMK